MCSHREETANNILCECVLFVQPTVNTQEYINQSILEISNKSKEMVDSVERVKVTPLPPKS